MKKILEVYYPIIIAFICMIYSIARGLSGNIAEAQYSAHWPGTILLFAIAIRQKEKILKQRKITCSPLMFIVGSFFVVYEWIIIYD